MLSNLVSPALNFVAFLLLLIVSLSVPIIKTIDLLSIGANANSSLINSGAHGSVRFGVWGYCISAIQVSVFGVDETTNSECSKPHLGYQIDQTVTTALGISGFTSVASQSLTVALVLHPIACGLSFLALLASLAMIRRAPTSSRLSPILILVTGVLAALFTTITFLIDVALVAIMRTKLNNALKDDNLQGAAYLNWGSAVWMTLGAAIALWAAVAATGTCTCGRYRKRRGSYRY